MCFIPDAFRELERRARRAHSCVECGRKILPGQTYLHSSGVWDGTPAGYRTCSRCAKLRVLAAREGYDDGSGCGLTFGGLLEAIRENLGARGCRRRKAAGQEEGRPRSW